MFPTTVKLDVTPRVVVIEAEFKVANPVVESVESDVFPTTVKLEPILTKPPINASVATPKPPPERNAPVDEDIEFVALLVTKTPPI